MDHSSSLTLATNLWRFCSTNPIVTNDQKNTAQPKWDLTIWLCQGDSDAILEEIYQRLIIRTLIVCHVRRDARIFTAIYWASWGGKHNQTNTGHYNLQPYSLTNQGLLLPVVCLGNHFLDTETTETTAPGLPLEPSTLHESSTRETPLERWNHMVMLWSLKILKRYWKHKTVQSSHALISCLGTYGDMTRHDMCIILVSQWGYGEKVILQTSGKETHVMFVLRNMYICTHVLYMFIKLCTAV